MQSLFVANIEMNENEGIYKKVCAQADAFPLCELITRSGKNAKTRKPGSDKGIVTDMPFLQYVSKQINSTSIKEMYVRHMIPNPGLVKLLKIAKKKNIKIYYEIPTYPYFGEQIRASRQKYRAIIKIALDILFWPIIYKYIDKLVIIRSSKKAKHYSKMVEITNGVRTDNIKGKDYSKDRDNTFRMVAVGTLYPYHGYDRVLKGMAECSEKIGDTKVEFHVVGSSRTIDDLHNEADRLGLKNVIFHGICSTQQLNDMYDNFDIGLGCLALHRRNADIDTTLKVIEYYCRGIPVVSSGECPMQDKSCTFRVPDNNDAVDISTIYNFYLNIPKEKLTQLSKEAKAEFSWENIMNKYVRK